MVTPLGVKPEPDPEPLDVIVPVEVGKPDVVTTSVDAKADQTLAARKQVESWVLAHRSANGLGGRPAPPGIPVSPLLENASDGTWPIVRADA